MNQELQTLIESQAKEYAQQRYDELGNKKYYHRKTIMRYAHMAGAKEWADKVERLEKALKLIEQMSDPGDHWIAVCRMKSIASDALTYFETIITPHTMTNETTEVIRPDIHRRMTFAYERGEHYFKAAGHSLRGGNVFSCNQ